MLDRLYYTHAAVSKGRKTMSARGTIFAIASFLYVAYSANTIATGASLPVSITARAMQKAAYNASASRTIGYRSVGNFRYQVVSHYVQPYDDPWSDGYVPTSGNLRGIPFIPTGLHGFNPIRSSRQCKRLTEQYRVQIRVVRLVGTSTAVMAARTDLPGPQ